MIFIRNINIRNYENRLSLTEISNKIDNKTFSVNYLNSITLLTT